MNIRKIISTALIVSLAFSVFSCSNTVDETKETVIDEISIETTDASIMETNAAEEIELIEEEKENLNQVYYDTLCRLIYKHVFPGREDEEIEYMELSGGMQSNEFAIYDVDSDGVDDLIISWVTASMAGMTYRIVEYDVDTGEWHSDYDGSCKPVFYSNDVVIVDALHNQGWGETIWPYSIYRYSASDDVYEYLGAASCWDRYFTEGRVDVEFPVDVDTDNANVVYTIEFEGYDGGYYSQSDYDKFWDSLVGNAEIVEIPYYPLTIENIEKVTGCTVPEKEVLLDLPDGDYMVMPYENYYTGEYENYFFADDGLSGEFYVKEYASFTQEYIDSLEPGDVIEQLNIWYDDIEISEIVVEGDNVYINPYYLESNGERICYSSVFFQKQENDLYYIRGDADEIETRDLGLYKLPISPEVEIYDNSAVFGVKVPTCDPESTHTRDIDTIQKFDDVLHSDDAWYHPNLFIRVTNGEIVMICINPCLHQPWRMY